MSTRLGYIPEYLHQKVPVSCSQCGVKYVSLLYSDVCSVLATRGAINDSHIVREIVRDGVGPTGSRLVSVTVHGCGLQAAQSVLEQKRILSVEF